MTVTKLFLIGNLTAPSTWVALIIAFVLSYIAIRLKFGKQRANRFGDAIFYVIIIWKLSVLITDFKIVINAPFALLYFNGGLVGFILGLSFVGFRTWLDWRKRRIDKDMLVALFIGAVSVQAIFQVMMVLLNEGSLFARVGTAVVFLSLLVFIWYNLEQSASHIVMLSLLFIAAHVFAAAIQPKGLMNPPLLVTVLIGLFFAVLFLKEPIEQTEGGQAG
ncbi:hypothetical protein M3193_06775 [Sporosarcina luteola]|uniref:hypothetical protein n=1 Tax=Sporosarcina luteola TaxID=582850 RepID=UPI002041D03B|nr:hypothetical protein [Sporosarcina luteola]MCM3743843.1 hypothetical protein [Sporosarcina luteola]